VPSTGFCKGKSGSLVVPNEVSDNAGTRYFEYRYMSNETDPNKGQIFIVTLTPGVRWLEEVLYEI